MGTLATPRIVMGREGGMARPFCLQILDPESSLRRRCLDPIPPPRHPLCQHLCPVWLLLGEEM